MPLQLAGTGMPYHVQVRPPVAEPPARATADARRDSATPAPAVLPVDIVAGNEPGMRENARRARRILDANIVILLLGETGTGKEAFAKALHQSSRRAARPFVPINCAAIPESLIESELFGYVEGAFTGARTKGMRGKILESDGGTLFLDEIGDMPVALQTRLLRVLAENEVQPLGGGGAVPVSLHVVCATHQDLEQLVREGRFRKDLYFRLAGATFHLPPLRERADAGLLIESLLAEEGAAAGRSLRLHADALHVLLRYRWPGNLRELRNTMRYAVHVVQSDVVRADDLPAHIIAPPATPAPAGGSVGSPLQAGTGRAAPAAADRDRIVGALRAHRWHVSATARTLGISRATLYRRMESLGIVPPNHVDRADPEG
ncbi:MAG: sigma 54-interacting transcriptional regulator [Burkholderiales bacterium]